MRVALFQIILTAMAFAKASLASACPTVHGMPNACPGRGYIDASSVTVSLVSPVVPPRCKLVGKAYQCTKKDEFDAIAESWKVNPRNWEIYFTLDGSEPSKTHGTRYTGPFEVSPNNSKFTSILRAIAYADDGTQSRISTHTYVFTSGINRQSKSPGADFPSKWGNGSMVNADYEMDNKVLKNHSAEEIAAAMKSIPMVSLVMDQYDLFDSACGIYMNPSKEGVARASRGEAECKTYPLTDSDRWKRRTSVEFSSTDVTAENPDWDGRNEPGAQVEAMIKIQGGSSRNGWKSKKVSMRLAFSEESGEKSFEYGIFKDASATTSFDSLVLDAHLNYTLTHGEDAAQRADAHYLGDALTSDLLNASKSNAPHGRFVNLFLNGVYWGLYELHEKPDESFAAAYLGGKKNQYDVYKKTSADLEQVAGTSDATWRSLWSRANQLDRQSNYQEFAAYFDIDDFIKYMIVNFFNANEDWPRHNWYAAINRVVPGSKFRFFSWDAEKTFNSADYDIQVSLKDSGCSDGPGELFNRLMKNATFRANFKSTYEKMVGTGVLSQTSARAIYLNRKNEVAKAIILESARWGDTYEKQAKNQVDAWTALTEGVYDNYFSDRAPVVLKQVGL